MKTTTRRTITIFITMILMTTTVFAATLTETIEVVKNGVRLEVNGKLVDTPNFVYEGTTYVPIRAAAETLGAEVTWDSKTKVAGIVTNNGTTANNNNVTTFDMFSTSPFDPTVQLSHIGVSKEDIDMVAIRDQGDLVSSSWVISSDKIVFASAGGDYGQNVLNLTSKYTLDIYKKDGTKVTGEFKTTGLPTGLKPYNYQMVYIPAMPEHGFNWPYYLIIPTDRNVSSNNNATSKQYLMVEGINNGSDNDYDTYINKLVSLRTELDRGAANGLDVAAALSMPYLMPLIPRPNVSYNLNGDENALYTHALDRDTAILDQLMADPKVGNRIIDEFQRGGFNPNDFKDITGQTANMINHCIDYLNGQGFGLEEKVMMYGYSAQGTFDDRFATLYPEMIKAYASGGTLDDLILPLASYKGEDLIFPLGVSDYKAITGNDFNLAAHNQVARLIYMGKDDTNDVTRYSDCYGDIERNLIYKLFGTNMLQRANSLTDLYGESGGKGMFILDVGIGHGFSYDMSEYVTKFFSDNRDSIGPAYPTPSTPKQLEYTVFK